MTIRRILTAVVLGSSAIAPMSIAEGWTTNAWPCQEWPRAGYWHTVDVYSAAVERASFAGVSTSVWPSVDWAVTNTVDADIEFYRNQGWRGDLDTNSNIKVLKDFVRSYVITNFVDRTLTNSAGVFEGIMNFTYYTEVGICSNANLPTNYFRYNPMRALNGVGPFTNDTSTAWPHGWTNEWTAAGGTTFPSGRYTWYTTDYGWAGLRKIIDLCVWTRHTPESGVVEHYESIQPWRTGSDCADSITKTKSSFQSRGWVSSYGSYVIYAALAGCYSSYDDAGYEDHQSFASLSTTVPATTNYACSVDIYAKPGVPNYWEIESEGEYYYSTVYADIEGIGLGETNKWSYWETLPESTNTVRGGTGEVGAVMGVATNHPIDLAGITCPLSGSPYYQSSVAEGCGDASKGFVIVGAGCTFDWILKWDGTNGFKYRAD